MEGSASKMSTPSSFLEQSNTLSAPFTRFKYKKYSALIRIDQYVSRAAVKLCVNASLPTQGKGKQKNKPGRSALRKHSE
jgi:hypothetical protein